ncbi:MAG TPA: DUF1572 family protein, partial [Flavitalea sp.]|nr:DUF1572 family protein [Flavitalea sp.]
RTTYSNKRQMNLAVTYLESAIRRVDAYRELSERAMSQLNDEDFYYRPNPQSNNIAIIIQHLSGNMISRWTNFLTEDGEKPGRSRDTEFQDQQYSRQQLMQMWHAGWGCFLSSLRSLKEEDLLKTIYIRTEPLIVIDAVNRQLSHYPNHAGQIIYIAKMIKGGHWKSLSIPIGESEEFNKKMRT